MKLLIPRIIKNWKSVDNFVMPSGEFKQNSASYGRKYLKHINAPFYEEAFSAFGLKSNRLEPILHNLIGNHYLEGASVHKHRDPAPAGYVHTRCNWMVKKPKIGGNPVLDNEEIEVEEGDLWLCLASLEEHSSTPIYGGERLIYSFGALVSMEQIEKIIAP